MSRLRMPHLTPATPGELAFLQAIVADPGDELTYLVLADWLEENDDPRRAELLRLHRELLPTCLESDQHAERATQQVRLVELLAEGVHPCVPRRTVMLEGGLEMTFSFIPPGTYLAGSPPGEVARAEDETQHRVTLTRGFWMGVHPVTQAQWQAVMGSNPSRFQDDDELPVELVFWEECQEFCRRLGQRDGHCYRLPTEAEWEYACRAGTTTPFHFGATIRPDQANYDSHYAYGKGRRGVSRQQTTPVGRFPPNAWGLFDTHGNVWEWCLDWYGLYPAGDSQDPQGPDEGEARVLRGGSWFSSPDWCRSALRFRRASAGRDGFIGCRVVLCQD